MVDSELVMIVEFCGYRSLQHQLSTYKEGGLPEQLIRHLCDDITAALIHAHSRQIANLEISPATIYITADGVFKLGKFRNTGENMVVGLGKVLYEVCTRKEYVGRFDFSSQYSEDLTMLVKKMVEGKLSATQVKEITKKWPKHANRAALAALNLQQIADFNTVDLKTSTLATDHLALERDSIQLITIGSEY